MKSYNRRVRRQRKPPNKQQKEGSFFSAPSAESFFQTKLTVGQPGDKYEQEADAVAQQVVHGNPSAKNIKPGLPSIQAMPKEEKENVQAAPETKEEEKKVQAKDDKEEKDKVQMQEEEKEKEKEEPTVQKKEESPAEAEEKKEEETSVMAKHESKPTAPHRGFEEQLQSKKGSGQQLPADTLKQMNKGIGANFKNVRVHTDEDAANMNRELGSRAFTHGSDIYFNTGKYDTGSATGKELLAHELTHVVQQQAAPVVHPATTTQTSRPLVQKQSSTALPPGVVPDKKTKVARFKDAGFVIKILPDKTAKKGSAEVKENGAVTKGNISVNANYETENGKVVSVKVTKELTIQTIYGSGAKATDTSAYGRGTTEEDKKKGDTTLRFHEGSHGRDFLDYIATHPFPVLEVTEPITKQEYDDKFSAWQEKVKEYQDSMEADSEKKTDKVGEPMH